MKFQDDPELEIVAHNCCRFYSIAWSREVLQDIPWTLGELVDAWVGAKARKIVNKDNIIVDDAALFEYLDVPLKVVEVKDLGMPTVVDENGILRVAQATAPIDRDKYWVLERWFWKQSHFVKGAGVSYLQPDYDPIAGGSQTRKNGTLMDLRVFGITK